MLLTPWLQLPLAMVENARHLALSWSQLQSVVCPYPYLLSVGVTAKLWLLICVLNPNRESPFLFIVDLMLVDLVLPYNC